MDIRQLQYFVAVYELKSISAASARLHVAHPSVSRTLQSLEADLNVELFTRHGRGILPTAAADQLYSQAQRLLQQFEAIPLHVQSEPEAPAGKIIFACTHQLGRVVAAQVTADFHKLYPKVTISVWEGAAATVYDWLLTGAVDAALLTSPPPSPAVKVWGKRRLPMFVIVSTRWREAPFAALVKDRLTLADVAKLPLILPRRGNSHRMLVEHALAPVKRALRIAFEVDGVDMINAMVSRNLGCAVLLRQAVEYETRLGLLTVLPIASPGIHAEVTVLSPRDRPQTRAVTAFIEMLKAGIAPASPLL